MDSAVLHYAGAGIGLGLVVIGAGLGIGKLAAAAADAPRTFSGATPLDWSGRLARSEMQHDE